MHEIRPRTTTTPVSLQESALFALAQERTMSGEKKKQERSSRIGRNVRGSSQVSGVLRLFCHVVDGTFAKKPHPLKRDLWDSGEAWVVKGDSNERFFFIFHETLTNRCGRFSRIFFIILQHDKNPNLPLLPPAKLTPFDQISFQSP